MEIDVTGIEAKVCQDIARRQMLGLAKYGVSLEQNPLGLLAWLQHSYEEKLDDLLYTRRAMEEVKAMLQRMEDDNK
jgi:hypothetical protein